MSRVASSSRQVREANARAVLDVVWRDHAATASHVMAATGLSRASVHDLCEQLITAGWIREVSQVRYGQRQAGRPARHYALAERAGLLVGLEAGLNQVRAVVTDLRGHVLGRAERSTGGSLDGAHRVRTVRDVLAEALTAAEAEQRHVLCMVVGVPAPVDAEGRTVLQGNAFWQAMNPDLVDQLAAPGRTVLVENVVNLAATAEAARGHARGELDHVTLHVDEGFGAAVVLGGRLLRGAHGGAGEMRFLDFVDGVGSPTGLAVQVVHEARLALDRPHRPSLLDAVPPDDLDAAAVLAAAGAGDPLASAVEAAAARRMTRVVEVLTTVFDPALVVLTGHVARHCERVRDAVQEGLSQRLEPPVPRVELSELGDDLITAGAVERAVDHVRRHAGSTTLHGRPAASRPAQVSRRAG